MHRLGPVQQWDYMTMSTKSNLKCSGGGGGRRESEFTIGEFRSAVRDSHPTPSPPFRAAVDYNLKFVQLFWHAGDVLQNERGEAGGELIELCSLSLSRRACGTRPVGASPVFEIPSVNNFFHTFPILLWVHSEFKMSQLLPPCLSRKRKKFSDTRSWLTVQCFKGMRGW